MVSGGKETLLMPGSVSLPLVWPAGRLSKASRSPESIPGSGPAAECRKSKPARACGHIAIYHSPAYVFIIAMPLQPSFRLAPESSVVISYYGNGAGKHRFRLAPE